MRSTASRRCAPRPGPALPLATTAAAARRASRSDVQGTRIRAGAVVDDHHLLGRAGRLPRPQRGQAVAQAGPPDGGDRPRRRIMPGQSPAPTRNGPIASTSTGVEPKHSSASRRSSTIGRPAVLRLVLTSTGRPVRCSKAASRAASSGCVRRVDRLDAGGAVHVHDGRDPVAPVRARRRARTACTGWESARGRRSRRPAPASTIGRDRPELLPALDVVEPVQVGRAGPGGPAATGGRGRAARTRCGPGTRPRSRRRPARRPPRDGQVRRPFERHPGGAQRGLDLGVGEAPAQVGAGHRPRPARPRRRRLQRRAERGARVAGRRLHPHLLERPAVVQHGVGHAVQRDAAGHGQQPVDRCGRAARRPAPAAPPPGGAARWRPGRRAPRSSPRRAPGRSQRGPVDRVGAETAGRPA